MAGPQQNSWMGLSPNQAAMPTQQQVTARSIAAPYTSYMDSPEVQQLIQQMEANRQRATQNQELEISDQEKLLQDYLAKNSKPQLDLSPLMALSDMWFGGNLAGSYKRPTDSKAQLETTAALQQGLQKARGALTDDEQQYLLSRLGLYQKADDAYLRSQLGQGKLDTQEAIARAKLAEASGKNGGLDLTPGQKALDVSFAKELDDWTSSGEAVADKNLNRLREARNKLAEAADNGSISGRVVGRLPDVLRSEESLAIQQDVHAAAIGALKATLGAQFTEKEGQRIMNMAYDPRLSPQENVKKIDAAIAELERSKENKNAKAAQFEAAGTLKDYRKEAPRTKPQAPSKDLKDLTREEKIQLLKARQAGGTP